MRTFQEVTSELPGRPARILKNQNVYILGIWASWCIITDYYKCFYKQTDTVSCMVVTSRLYITVSYGSCMVAASDLYSTVSYGRAVQTPSAVDAIRWHVVQYIIYCASAYGKKLTCFGISKSVRSPPVWLKVSPPSAWLGAAPPSSPSLPASEPVSLPRPCLPRMEMFGGGGIIGEGV